MFLVSVLPLHFISPQTACCIVKVNQPTLTKCDKNMRCEEKLIEKTARHTLQSQDRRDTVEHWKSVKRDVLWVTASASATSYYYYVCEYEMAVTVT